MALTQVSSGLISSVANTAISGNIISSQITSVANTQITGLMTASQIASVANTQITGIISTSNGGTGTSSWTAGTNYVAPGTSTTFTALQTFNGTLSNEAIKLLNAAESANIVAAAPASTQTIYVANGAVVLFTSNSASNWTANVTFSTTTSLNTAMSVGDSVTVAMLTSQGGTAYYPTALNIDGSAVSPKWQGGSSPSSGNINGIDAYIYSIIKTASATYTVLASQTQFK
jgi:hypothetical protein